MARTERELQRLNRRQLLGLLLIQTKQIEDLENKIAVLERQLSDRRIQEEEAGNIAEAALKLNRVFEAAQAAADQYLENVKRVVRTESEE